jgi:hypothetical protein
MTHREFDSPEFEECMREIRELEAKHDCIIVPIFKEDATIALFQAIDQGEGWYGQAKGIVDDNWNDVWRMKADIKDAYSGVEPLLKAMFPHVADRLRGWGIGYDDTEFRKPQR